MRMKVGDLKRLGSSGQYHTSTGYVMVFFPSGVIGARTPCGSYFELQERSEDVREAKRKFIEWANRHQSGLE